MTLVTYSVLGIAGLVALALVAHFVESLGDRIATGRSPRRPRGRAPRAADTGGHNGDAGDVGDAGDSGAPGRYDKKLGDGSGLAGF